jgi:hypothetical protein
MALEGFTLVPDIAGYAALVTGFGVARDLARRSIAVESQAKLNASHPRPSVRGSGPAVRSGRLRSSIAWQLGRDELGLYSDVGSNVVYAYRVEVDYDRPYLKPALNAARI